MDGEIQINMFRSVFIVSKKRKEILKAYIEVTRKRSDKKKKRKN